MDWMRSATYCSVCVYVYYVRYGAVGISVAPAERVALLSPSAVQRR